MKKSYQFQFSQKAELEFAALERSLQKRIFEKLSFFEHSDDPLAFAKKLRGMDRFYRFRVGDYRIIVTPKDKKTFIILLILKIGHRREVYE